MQGMIWVLPQESRPFQVSAAAASAAASATGGAAADVADETKALLEYHRKGNPYL
jgi:hypothetical protein